MVIRICRFIFNLYLFNTSLRETITKYSNSWAEFATGPEQRQVSLTRTRLLNKVLETRTGARWDTIVWWARNRYEEPVLKSFVKLYTVVYKIKSDKNGKERRDQYSREISIILRNIHECKHIVANHGNLRSYEVSLTIQRGCNSEIVKILIQQEAFVACPKTCAKLYYDSCIWTYSLMNVKHR